MDNVHEETVLAQSAESRKYPTVEKLVSICSSNDNELVVVGGHSQDGKGIMYTLGSDGGLKWSQTYPQAVSTVSVAARGTFVGIGGVDNNIYYFTSHGELAWSDDCRSDVRFMVISADGRFICIGLADGNINFYDNDIVAARKFVWKHRFDKPVSTLCMNADGTMVGAGTEEGEIAVFTERGDLVWTKLLDGKINKMALSPEGDAVVVACSDNKLRYYSAEIGRTLWSAEGDGVFIDVDITHKGERTVGISKDNNLYGYDKKGGLLWKYDLGNPGERVRMAMDGKTIVASSIDTTIHCVDAKGNLLWRFRAGGSGVAGIRVSNNGDIVVISSDAGVLYFENLQVIGGILPKVRHEITKGKQVNIPTFKAEKYYEEAVVALNYGDYIVAAEKIRAIEASLKAPKPAEPSAIPPLPASPTEDNGDLAQKLRSEIDAILRKSEELKKKGVDVEPVENLLGEAMILLEDGDPSEAEAYIKDSKEMMAEFANSVPEGPPEEPKPAEEATDNKSVAMEAVEKASKMLAKLDWTSIKLDMVKADIMTARNLIGTAEFQRAIAAANRAVISMEKALDPYITECLINVQKLKGLAEKKGVNTEDATKKLLKTNEFMGAGDYLGALESVRVVEEWLEEAIQGDKDEKEPGISIPPPPSFEGDAEEKEPDHETEPEPDHETEPEPEAEPEPDHETEPEPEHTTEVEPVKPSLDVESISAGTEDPEKALTEADEALNKGEYSLAVDKYIITMEALEARARGVVEQAIGKATEDIEKVKNDGIDASEAEDLLGKAEKGFADGDYRSATSNALLAIEKADGAATAEIAKVIEDSRKALKMATELGADIAMAEDMIKNAEEALGNRDFKVAVEFADKGIAEVENASNDFITKVLIEGKELLENATEIGANIDEIKPLFVEVQQAIEEKDFIRSHELAKKAVEMAGALPKTFVQEKLAVARSKVIVIEKIGADTMMAKNFLIRARSSMAAGDFTAALQACEKCVEEADKAPKVLVNRRIATARADMEAVKSMGQSTDDVEGILADAEKNSAEGNYDDAQGLVENALEMLGVIKGLGTEATNAIFDADVSISIARDAGKDVSKANELLHEAMDIRAKDPAKAKEIAEQIKGLLEG